MFRSILHPGDGDFEYRTEEPECFMDLNLDQVLNSVFRNGEDDFLRSVYYTPLKTAKEIEYRQQVLKELSRKETGTVFFRFSEGICLAEAERKNSEDQTYLTCGKLLNCYWNYVCMLRKLQDKMKNWQLKSEGLQKFKIYLDTICRSQTFVTTAGKLENIRGEFQCLRYCILIRNGTVHVKKYQEEEDLLPPVCEAFQKFCREEHGTLKNCRVEKPSAGHVEEGILSCLAKIYPVQFDTMIQFLEDSKDFFDPVIIRFAEEIRFYLLWLAWVQRLKEAGFTFFYPQMTESGNSYYCNGFCDLALAEKIGSRVVKNDFSLEEEERIFVVTGPNQGGKTTFSRAFGQIHYLAALGLCIPGTEGVLKIPDRIFTHFEKKEEMADLNGKLKDDLKRLKEILDGVTDSSLVIINEIFSSTTFSDALELGKQMMDALADSGAECVIVTFLKELSEHGRETVSLQSMTETGQSHRRTFKIVRKKTDGRAYANTLAEKHGLGYEQILRRITE